MDLSSSIAKRTRSKEALFYKTEFERRKKSNGGSTAGLSACGSKKSGKSNGGGVRVGDCQELGFKTIKGDKDASKGCDHEVFVDDSEEEVVEVRDGVGKRGFDSFCNKGLGLKFGLGVEERRDLLKPQGFDKGKNVVSIDVDDSESSGKEKEQESFQFGGVERTHSKVGVRKDFSSSSSVSIDTDESEYESCSSDDTEDSERSVSVEELTSCSGDEDGNVDVNEDGYGDGDGDGEDTEVSDGGETDGSAETRLKKRRVYGLDLLIPAKRDKNNPRIPPGESISIAQRTRSHFDSGSSNKKKKELGTINHPICFDEKKIDSSSGCDSDNADNDDETDSCDEDSGNENNGIGDERDVGTKNEAELGKPTKRKRVCAPKGDCLFNLFVNTIWEKGEVLQRELSHSEDEAPEQDVTAAVVSEASLPLKFSFGVKESKLQEKSDYEKEMDHLWAEFDFAIKSNELGSFGCSMVDIEDANKPEDEADPSSLCDRGRHQLILDEQIGIKCRFCSFVKLEIKYILPPLDTHRSEIPGKKISSGIGDFSMLDGFHFQDDGDSQRSCIHSKGTVWDKFPSIRQRMYPHQQEGFEFMWKNLAGGIELDKLKSANSDGDIGGCVISHAPGTGKTLLTIVFLQTYMEIFKECRPVIIAPCSMLLTWEEEFKKWKVDIPFHNLNTLEFSGKEDPLARKLVQNRSKSKKWNRIVKLVSWSRGKSILGVSYPLFQKLAGKRYIKDNECKKRREVPLDKEGEEIRKILLEKPSLLVLDEGHTPRNERSHIWKALEKIKTERRIILSGTPFQNNFDELYNTLWLVRPTFADRISSKTRKLCQRKSQLQEGKEARGKWVSLTSSIGKHTDDGLLETVRSMIDPFVHVHRGSILKENLPGLRDCVVVLYPPPLQKHILEGIQGIIPNPLELEHTVSLVSVHPSLLTKCSLSGNEQPLIEKISSKRFMLNPNEGVKTKFLIELIRLSEVMNEKVLVFSQYIDPLVLIKDQLHSLFNWTEGKEVLQMDGKLTMKVRQSSINLFNDPSSNVRVLLASTRACREGISLVGASRIVFLDVVWNPSVERQATSRAYRLGQRKVVYTYHLLASGTMEVEKYGRQVGKDRLSKLVFLSTHGCEANQNDSSTVSDDKILEEMVRHDKLKNMFEKIIFQPKESSKEDVFFQSDECNTSIPLS